MGDEAAMLTYNVPLAQHRKAVLILPPDLTIQEAMRLSEIVEAVAFKGDRDDQ